MISRIFLLNFIVNHALCYDLAQLIYEDAYDKLAGDLRTIESELKSSRALNSEIRLETNNENRARAIKIFFTSDSFKEIIIFKEKSLNQSSSENKEPKKITFSLQLKENIKLLDFKEISKNQIKKLELLENIKKHGELNITTHKENCKESSDIFLRNIEKLDSESEKLVRNIFSEGISNLERSCKNFYVEFLLELQDYFDLTESNENIIMKMKFPIEFFYQHMRFLTNSFLMMKFNLISPEIEITVDTKVIPHKNDRTGKIEDWKQMKRKIIIPKDLDYSLSFDLTSLKEKYSENKNLSLKEYFLKIQRELSSFDKNGESFLNFRKTLKKIFDRKVEKEGLKSFFNEEKEKKGDDLDELEKKFLNKKNEKSISFDNYTETLDKIKAERELRFLEIDATKNDEGFVIVHQVEDEIIIYADNTKNHNLKVGGESEKDEGSETIKKNKGKTEGMGILQKVAWFYLLLF